METIRHYALDRGAISLEHAIRSSTALPARIMDLKDRGQIREGYAADIVVFDLATIRDKATFFEPHQHSEGIEHRIVDILANPLVLLAPLLAARVRPQGQIVLSGVLAAQVGLVVDTYARWFNIAPWRDEEGWVALVGLRQSD